MKVRTSGRMCILKHSILALERVPNMYRTPSTSGEPLPAVRELSANCNVYVSSRIVSKHIVGTARARATTFILKTFHESSWIRRYAERCVFRILRVS